MRLSGGNKIHISTPFHTPSFIASPPRTKGMIPNWDSFRMRCKPICNETWKETVISWPSTIKAQQSRHVSLFACNCINTVCPVQSTWKYFIMPSAWLGDTDHAPGLENNQLAHELGMMWRKTTGPESLAACHWCNCTLPGDTVTMDLNVDIEHHHRACVLLTVSPLAPYRSSWIWFHQYALEEGPRGEGSGVGIRPRSCAQRVQVPKDERGVWTTSPAAEVWPQWPQEC